MSESGKIRSSSRKVTHGIFTYKQVVITHKKLIRYYPSGKQQALLTNRQSHQPTKKSIKEKSRS